MEFDDIIFHPLKLPESKKHTRYLLGRDVKGDVILRLSSKGFCNWCGKSLTGRSKVFCPKSKREIYQFNEYEDYWCTREFYAWWHSYPRFKRAIFLRDKCTCQNCGLKPIVENKYGLTMPDLSLLAIDHIHPFSKGGETEEDNLQVLCRKCNGKKRDIPLSIFQEKQSQIKLELGTSL